MPADDPSYPAPENDATVWRQQSLLTAAIRPRVDQDFQTPGQWTDIRGCVLSTPFPSRCPGQAPQDNAFSNFPQMLHRHVVHQADLQPSEQAALSRLRNG